MLWVPLKAPRRGASNEYPQHMFSWRNKKIYLFDTPLIWSSDVGSESSLGALWPANDQVYSGGIKVDQIVLMCRFRLYADLSLRRAHTSEGTALKLFYSRQ